MNSARCPVVFFNAGIQEFLLFTLTQAQRLNPDSPVILFCNSALPDKFGFVQQIPFAQFSGAAREFAATYRHFSVNAELNEVLCMQRWFVIRDFLREHHFERIMYLDSDVLLFCSVENVKPFFSAYDFAFSLISGHTSFLTLPVIEELCDLLTGYYSGTNHALVEHLENEKRLRAPNGPSPTFNISDMSFIKYYVETSRRPHIEISQVHRPPSGPFIFDHNINVSDGLFVMDQRCKKIDWIDGAPFGTLSETGEKVRFCSVHFQGAGKPLVPEFFDKTGNGSAHWRP